MNKKQSLRLVVVLLVLFCLYMSTLLVPPPSFEKEPVDNYLLSNDNNFATKAYYKQSTHVRAAMDVTLITQVSVDRLSRIQKMVETWRAPLSVAVFVKPKDQLSLIDEMFEQSELVQSFVDFHLLYANKTRYPVNNLRNLALKNARTSLVMILDADFITSEDMSSYLSTYGRELKATPKLAYIIPAFSSDLPPNKLPRTKPQLLTSIKNKTVNLVNEGPCPKCHGPTDYNKWMTAKAPYSIQYKWIYEPYLFLNKDHLVEYFDERLKGYGFDKNTHSYTLAVAGYSFYVLPESFVIHLNHPEAAWDGPSIQKQLWDALEYVCDIIPTMKDKYGYSSFQRLFDEPVGLEECRSKSHW